MTSFVGLDTSRVPGKRTAQAYQYGVLYTSGGNGSFVIDLVKALLLDLTGAMALAFAGAQVRERRASHLETAVPLLAAHFRGLSQIGGD